MALSVGEAPAARGPAVGYEQDCFSGCRPCRVVYCSGDLHVRYAKRLHGICASISGNDIIHGCLNRADRAAEDFIRCTITVNVGVAGGCITTTTPIPKTGHTNMVIAGEVFVEKGIGRSL